MQTRLYIDNQWQDATDGANFPVDNPATEALLAHVAQGGAADVARAVDAAKRRASELNALGALLPRATPGPATPTARLL